MLSRQEYERREEQSLASYAIKSGASEGRVFCEAEHENRTCFQRDRDRVIHSRAFRRLEYKTQVFVNHEGDHYRTRLTHSLEVAQIARTLARILKLNEDLTEAISLAHDLGHTPFGHSGEHIMSRLMKHHKGFEHNRQSFRVVTFLEDRYPNFPGLNLTYEVLEGMTKHASEYDLPQGEIFKRSGYPSLEAQICNFADEIAYNNHDLDDGLKSQMITLNDLQEVAIWKEQFTKVSHQLKEESLSLQITQTIRYLINFLVTDLATQTEKNISQLRIKTVSDVRKKAKNCVSFSPKVKAQNQELKRFLMKSLYRHYRVMRMADKAERIITELFNAYVRNPNIMPSDFFKRYEIKKTNIISHKKYESFQEPLERIVCDYIAGMTDRFALDEYKKLFDPHEKV